MIDVVGPTTIPLIAKRPSKTRCLELRFNKYQLIRQIIDVEKPFGKYAANRQRNVNSKQKRKKNIWFLVMASSCRETIVEEKKKDYDSESSFAKKSNFARKV